MARMGIVPFSFRHISRNGLRFIRWIGSNESLEPWGKD